VRPTPAILDAFGVDGPVSRLVGGQGTAWRAGQRVLKPLDMPLDALEWLDRVVRPLTRSDGLRLSLPVRSRSGAFLVEGWTAFDYLPGRHEAGRWHAIADVAREFSALLTGVEHPSFIDARTDAWSTADRFAWGEHDLTTAAAAVTAAAAGIGTLTATATTTASEAGPAGPVPHLAQLLAVRRPVGDASAIVHADLTGNVLFAADARPAVIDLSLYWRPVNYAIAIVAVDAVCFEKAPLSLFETISSDPQFAQFLVRALLFRMTTDWLRGAPATAFAAYDRAVQHVTGLLA
jgi:uncharacterized protein (TIGR02569 family)